MSITLGVANCNQIMKTLNKLRGKKIYIYIYIYLRYQRNNLVYELQTTVSMLIQNHQYK